MHIARHGITGEVISAAEALKDRKQKGFVPLYLCTECGDPASLRRNGKGEDPYFFHLPHYTRPCSLRTGNNPFNSLTASQDSDAISLSKTLLQSLSLCDEEITNKASPQETAPAVAKFLSWGIDLKTEDINPIDKARTTIAKNIVRLLYQPRCAVLLRWLCALFKDDELADKVGPERFARAIRRKCLKLPLFEPYMAAGTSSAFRESPPPSPPCPHSRHLFYATDIGLLLEGSQRASIIEFESFPAEVSFSADKATKLTITRHSSDAAPWSLPQDVHITPLGHTLRIDKPEGILVSPHHSLSLGPTSQPLLYILPRHKSAAAT